MASCNIAETESQNFHRIASLLIDSGSKVLRELLMAHVRPSGLSLDQYLLNNKPILDALQKKKVLNPNQVSLLFPGNKNADLASFDITLLCVLLKNVFGKLPPQEWKEIEQLRKLRNEVTGHTAKAAIGGSDFSIMWKDISQVIDNLAKCTGDLNFVKEMTDEINDLSLKPKLIPSSHYPYLLKLLLEWKNSEQEVKEQLDEIVSDVDVLKKDVEEIKKCQINRRLGEHQVKVEPVKWEQENMIKIFKMFVQDKTKQQYVKTELMEGVATMLQTKGSCVISGKPGEGKTLAAASIMKDCFDLDKCLVLNEASDWRFVDVEKTEAIFIDDIFGKYKLDEGRLSAWMPVLEKFAACAGTGNREIKVLITTRGNVLKNCHSQVAHINLFENVIEFSSDKLLDEEKKQMLTMMLEGHKKVLEEPKIERCVKQFTSPIGFPFCCQLFATDESLFNLGEKFFKKPYNFFKKNIETLKESKRDFVALVFLFYGGRDSLQGDELLDTNKKFSADLTEISNSLGLSTPLTPAQAKHQLNQMTGNYVTCSEGSYQFVHNMVAEAVGLLYGESNPKYIIRNCSIDFLHQCVTVPGCVVDTSDQDITEKDKLQVEKNYQPELAERLIKEVIDKKEVLRTASHPALREMNFLSLFIQAIQNKKCKKQVLKSKGIVSMYDRGVYFLSLYAEVVCSDVSLNAEDFLSKFLDCLHRCKHQAAFLRRKCWKCKLVDDCMSVCFECGCVKASRTLLEHLNGAVPDSKSLNCAAKGGNFDIFMAVRDQGAQPDRDTVTWAARGGNMDIVKNALDAGRKPETQTVNWAAWRGNLEIVLAVMEKGAKPDKNTVDCAIEGCGISFSPETSTTGDASKIRGNFEIVKAVLERGAKPDQATQYRAIRGGNVDIVKAVLDPKHGVKPNKKTANCAVKGGDVDIIRAVLERGAKPDEKTVELAVKTGNAEIINVLSEFVVIPDAETELGN